MDKKEMLIKSGAKLKELRKATGMSVFKVGKAIGMSGSYVSQFERGSCPPSDAALIALSDLYGVDKQKLFDLYVYYLERDTNTQCQSSCIKRFILTSAFSSSRDI